MRRRYSCAADYAIEAGHRAEESLLPALLLNEAQCRLHLQQPRLAVQLCSRVLEREPENVKALYRRAVAKLELAEFVEARRSERLDMLSCAREAWAPLLRVHGRGVR